MPVRIGTEHRTYAFDGQAQPAVAVAAGEVVVLETMDCYDGQISLDVEPPSDDNLQRGRGNPATGPVFVTGAMPGDMLIAHIEGIQPASRGLLFGSSRDRAYREGWVVPVADGIVSLPGGVRAPCDTVIGVIGVAPEGEPVLNTTPGDHGGNLDTTDVRVGSTVYLPVAHEGALFGLGDLHAVQGDGELCGQGVEIAGEVAVRLSVMKGNMGRWPIIEAADHWSVLASAQTLDEAVDLAVLRARDFVMARLGVKDHEAIALISTLCDARVSQIVNPLRTARVCVPKTLAGGL